MLPRAARRSFSITGSRAWIQLGNLFLIVVVFALVGGTGAGRADAQTISANALQQIQALLREKQARNSAQRKLSSALIYASTRARGVAPASIPDLGNPDTSLNVDNRYGVLVDIKASVSSELLNTIRQAGGRVIDADPSGTIRARIPLNLVEPLAAAWRRSFHQGGIAGQAQRRVSEFGGNEFSGLRPLAVSLRGRIEQGPPNLLRNLGLAFFIGLTSTQGTVTHDALGAIRAFGANGAGVRVGVLSDSAEFIPALIASGDLPPDTQNVADIQEGPGSSEGSAMMEIVYDMAPGVRLFFASAFNSPNNFARNIRLLRNTYHCDVIVDDVGWSDEGVFQDTVIAKAVR